jgi:hypothetical protein
MAAGGCCGILPTRWGFKFVGNKITCGYLFPLFFWKRRKSEGPSSPYAYLALGFEPLIERPESGSLKKCLSKIGIK